MSVSKETTIWCDWGDAPDSCLKWEQVAVPRAVDARKQLRRQGWAHKDGQDYCPRHAFGATGDPRHIVATMRRSSIREWNLGWIHEHIDATPDPLAAALEHLVNSGVLRKKGRNFVFNEASKKGPDWVKT